MRYFGAIGYGVSQEAAEGVWEDVITERKYYGDVIRNTLRSRETEVLNNTLSLGNSISVLADAFALNNFMNIRYLEWVGKRWIVLDVEIKAPRLIIRLGGLYNGPGPVPGVEDETPPPIETDIE